MSFSQFVLLLLTLTALVLAVIAYLIVIQAWLYLLMVPFAALLLFLGVWAAYNRWGKIE